MRAASEFKLLQALGLKMKLVMDCTLSTTLRGPIIAAGPVVAVPRTFLTGCIPSRPFFSLVTIQLQCRSKQCGQPLEHGEM